MRPSVLLVDDNEEILEFLEEELSEKYLLYKALNGKEALGLVKQEMIHLIICDIMMPEVNGFELCRIIKSDVEFSHIPIILLTAKNTLQSKIEGLELGADAYIEKPFSPVHLQAQIASLLMNRNKIKEHFAATPLSHITSMAYTKADENFLHQLHKAIEEHIADQELDVEKLARLLTMSRPTLYRKISAISNLSPNELIHIARLKKAAELLLTGQHKMSDITDMVGYHSQANFSRSFHKQFGMTPTEYVQSKKIEKTL
jgi:DNA-binding response OmpR family regulator